MTNREEIDRYSMTYVELYNMVKTVETRLRKEWNPTSSNFNTPDIHDFWGIANEIGCFCRNYTEEKMLEKVKGTVKEVTERMR
jgi:hypothetical protein